MHEYYDSLYTKKYDLENIPKTFDDDYNIQSNFTGYIIGFVLAIILTIISFLLVITKVINNTTIISLILFFLAIIQITVHMICFLHMNFKSENGWTILALIFTTIVVIIMITGSLWVMYHMNHNMMPK